MMSLAYVPMHYAGGGFPWGFLIVGVLVYLAWRNGFFDGFGRHGGGPRYGGFGPGFGPGQARDNEQVFHGPRAEFEEWHRQAHAADAGQPAAPPTAPTAPSQGTASPPVDDRAL
jgi:hypothetical protein